MKRPVLVHYHIFKNAGTSFNWALRQCFGDRFREYDTTDPDGKITSDELLDFIERDDSLRAVSSHQTCFPAPESEDVRSVATVFVRHPLARIRSIYTFQRKQDPSVSAGARAANEHGFREFVEWSLENYPATILNFQTCFCSTPEMRAGKAAPGIEELEIAKRNLERAAVAGVVERYDESLRVANAALARDFPEIELRANRLNTTSGAPKSRDRVIEQLRGELGADLVVQLEERNYLDEALYDFADTLLDQRLARLN